ncbi:Helicase domain protein [Dissulfuribacter thermophilus]|uniref:Helicase domain protein n=1 Tax=Dissulfuribacter thermophilus TaxID=1156395 RepID=A0A1B9F5X1_9BACT|nr:DEAD/DEAH box helicase [Dissulfuribacter thermophilus]OCC15300.1 Helicase domain protein [Dissulfuribacter thermophilus]
MAMTPIEDLIYSIGELEELIGTVCFKKLIPASPPDLRDFNQSLLPEIKFILEQNGIYSLYSHQLEAINEIINGKNVIISTPTASGKSLIYNIPVIQSFLENKGTKALYLFPLKALQQDQLKHLTILTSALDDEDRPKVALLDGDTPQYRRRRLREQPPNILITNPDMLHLSILPYHNSWSNFLKDLEFVVIDEVHTYRGVMGSNMAWVFRRLERIANYYGKTPIYIMSSATVGNPSSLSKALIGKDVVCISKQSSPTGRRHIVFINPIQSPSLSCLKLLEMAIKRRLRTIVYTQSRKLTELLGLWINQKGSHFKRLVKVYRAGLLPEERRDIEAKLASGELLGVVSTSALELGIDIGSLDCSILLGYPGSIMATWQRWGRAGRKRQDSLVALIAHEDALDQYIMRHPETVISGAPEPAILNPENPRIMEKHIECAACELSISTSEPFYSENKTIQQTIEALTRRGKLFFSEDARTIFAGGKYPHRFVDLRGTGSKFRIVHEKDGNTIGDIDGIRALKETHPGAIYLHGGRTFRVTDLDFDLKCIKVEDFKGDYFTRPLSQKETSIIEEYESKVVFGTLIHFGKIRVREEVVGYEMRSVRGQRFLGKKELELPPQVFETEGLWLEIPDFIRENTEKAFMHFMGGIHAIEHAMIGVMPLLVLTDRSDIGGISQTIHPQVGKSTIFVYDGIPGGIGLTKEAFKKASDLIRKSLGVIESCSCELGCPGCVHSPKCGSGNRPIDKAAAISILRQIIKGKKKREEDAPRLINQAVKIPKQRVSRECDKPKLDISSIRFGVFDLETQYSAQEVGGWHLAHKMKVSCAVLYDSKEDRFLEYMEENVQDLIARLKSLDLVIGFNIKRFDYRVLSGYEDGSVFSTLPTLDLLEEVKKRLGYRLSLDHLAASTLGSKKAGNGLLALRWWKQGELEKLIRYCKEDVRLTRDLFLHGHEKGYLLFKNKAGRLVRLPVSW